MFTLETFEKVPKFSGFKYWFIRTGYTTFNILLSGEKVGAYDDLQDTLTPESLKEDREQIAFDFANFRLRPEFSVGEYINLDGEFVASYMPDLYETLLVGVSLIRAHRNGSPNPDDAFNKILPVLEYLRQCDFYRAPASTIYHESVEMGLVHHTLLVCKQIADLKFNIEKFQNVMIEDAILVALTHDWCKIDIYESYMRNVKNEDTGVWEQKKAFRKKVSTYPFGHGSESMYRAMKCFRLSRDEALAIRWHMGVWNVADAEMNDLQHANEMVPLVHLLQFADQLAIVSY